MQLPFFYIESADARSKSIVLDEETSRHVVQVLRMKKDEKINLTDGKGKLLSGIITNDHKKHCTVEVINSRLLTPDSRLLTIAISLLKNSSRFEWFLEKATEIGVYEIIPLICERTEKQKFRYDRMKGILISAMLQSQQCWLPMLHEPVKFDNLILAMSGENIQKFIAHCNEGDKKQLSNFHKNESFGNIRTSPNSIILIGPEGDFTEKEIELVIKHAFIPVALGETRLRSETAGIVAATILKIYS